MVYLLLLMTATCSAGGMAIRGFSTPGVEQVFENGGLILLSEKENTVSMYNTTPKVDTTCNFFVRIVNESSDRKTFWFKDLVVTDQWGRLIPVRKKSSVVKSKRKSNSVREFFNALGNTSEAINTYDNAGKIKYEESSNACSSTHARVGRRINGTTASANVSAVSRERVRESTLTSL